jgi:amino acid transporter
MNEPKRLSVSTVAMLLVAVIFGIGNVTDNLAALGLSAIPSWLAVGILYFVPLSLMMAELGSAATSKRGGIYSYMEVGLGPIWAFIGTWAYFVANLVYLQMVCSRTVINASLASTGRDVFEGVTWLVPFLGAALCVALTWFSTRGVQVFSGFVSAAGRLLLVCNFGLILVALVAVGAGFHESATVYHAADLVPSLDLQYFSTFSWLLFAVAGAEAAGPYVHDMRDPEHSFPRAILTAAVLVGALYVLGTVATSFLLPVGSINKATAVFNSWYSVGAILHLPPEPVARVFMSMVVLVSIMAYVVWMDSPIRAMFSEVPPGTFPAFLTRQDESGTLHHALWTQAAVVCTLIFVPLFSILTGLSGSDRLISLLNDLTSLALVVPYLFVSVAYVRARRAGLKAPFQMVRSTSLAVGIGVMTFALSALGYVGAGLYALDAEEIDWIYVATVYLGPGLLILLGLLVRWASLRRAAALT